MTKAIYETSDASIRIAEPQVDLDLTSPFHPTMLPEDLREGQDLGGGQSVGVVWERSAEPFIRTAFVSRGSKPCGEHRTYHSNGLVAHQSFYHGEKGKEGILHGPARSFDPDGNCVSLAYFVEGQRQGKCVEYYPSGKEYSVAYYKNAVLEGPQIVYYEDGQIKTQVDYHRGCMHGEVRLFHDNGEPKRRVPYSHGKQHGTERMWDRKGTLTMEREFREGRVLHEKYWSADGVLLEEQIHHPDRAHRDVVKWDLDGNRRYEITHDQEGRFHRKLWDDAGQIVEEVKGRFEEGEEVIDEILAKSETD